MLINRAWFRVGYDRHARRSRTYGITTLTKRHVSLFGDEIAFRFRAKNGKVVGRRNAVLAREVRISSAFPTDRVCSASSGTERSPT
jgi:DNA topoisomerase I